MKEYWKLIQIILAGIGGYMGYFVGGIDGLINGLIAFVIIDYITGVMCAITDKRLSSAVGFKGIFRKILIFMLVGIANFLDVKVIGTGSALRTVVIVFYLSNEGVSILENATHLSLPIPEKLKSMLMQIGETEEKNEQ